MAILTILIMINQQGHYIFLQIATDIHILSDSVPISGVNTVALTNP